MIAHPEGRQIMKDRPIVSSQTVNLDHLKSLKRGTLGREYVEWLQRGDLSPDSREKVRYQGLAVEAKADYQVRYIDSPTLAYTMLRYRQTHDLYHTLFSLPPTLVHELSLKVVELSNMSLPVAGLSSTFGPLRMTSSRRALWRQDWVPWALRTGALGRSLVGVYWEKRWEQGLGELRRELGVQRNDEFGVESRWRGYRELRDMERGLRRKGEWVDEPEQW
jgi:ubiquinone biosynthesis protein COQ4